MSFYLQGFWILSVICVILYLVTRAALPTVTDANFSYFQRSYLAVYLLAMAGDWLQGPHVYVLYDSYGMSKHQIEILFVAGFGSSMIFGTIVGSFADRYGRRANCILYGILYSLACITKHFANFWILMVGRLLGGMATSILYSAFESWLVYEHHKGYVTNFYRVTTLDHLNSSRSRGFESDLLGNIFSHAVLGNSLVAIIAGLLAQKVADIFGFVAPFDVSILLLCMMVVLIIFTWTENYGDKGSSIRQSFGTALKAIRTDHKILCLGLIQSLFEGSMYVFVLEWTPALTSSVPEEEQANKDNISEEGHRGSIPHGHIFAAFMVAIMIGSSLFKLLSKYTSVESFMRIVLFVSGLALATPIIFAENHLIIFTGFLVFETCVGIFWPSLSTMRGKYVPEETRATTMNLFRIPLNLIVVFILLQGLPMRIIFQCCTLFLLLATLVQQWLYKMYEKLPKTHTLPSTLVDKLELPKDEQGDILSKDKKTQDEVEEELV